MNGTKDGIDERLQSFHEEVPMTTRVSLTMSKHNRDILAEIRDDINATANDPILETNDVIRLALLGAVHYEEVLTDPDSDVKSASPEIAPLLSILAENVRNDPNFGVGN